MSNMTTKSDFAQKLLTDLRQRKERMAAAQSSGRQSSQTSRVTRGNTGQASRGGGGRQINALESVGKTSRRSNAGTIKDSSNQIVLYEGNNQTSRQVKDLQMAIAFAFENSGNLTTIGGSTTNPLVNFFNRFGRKFQKTQTTTTFYNRRSSSQIPTVSHIHVNEISKGVHKLNQILTACSNGLNFDRNSIEIGRELLKGAINLEESLRMLVNLQDASEYYSTGSQKKSRLKLLDEEEEEEEEEEHSKKAEQWKLDRPRFSFDKTNRHKQLALTYDHEPIASLKVVPHRRSNSSVQDLSSSKSGKEKGRISNVVAKLMGLEEIPQKGDLRDNIKQNQPRKDLKMTTTIEPKPTMVKKQQSNVELQRKVQNTKMIKSEDRTSIRMQQEITPNNNLSRNQEMVPKRAESSEEKKSRFAEQKPHLVTRNHVNSPKPKRSSTMNVQKKLANDKPIKPNTKDPPKRRQDASVVGENMQKAAANQQERPKIEGQSSHSPKFDVGSLKEEKAVDEVTVTQKRDVARKVQRREVPQKMEVMVSRRNGSGKNLTKTTKRPDNMLKDLKQQMQRKNRGLKRMEEQSDSKAKEGEEEKLKKKDDIIISESVLADEIQNQKIENKLILDSKSETVVSSEDVLNDLQKEEQPSLPKEEEQGEEAEEEELKKYDQSIESHEEITEPDLPQQQHTTTTTTTNKQEQLTEPEKTLKETLIKSQLFLSTAEALFKLNIPLSFLHETEPKSSNLVLDTAHEVLKRKARRLEATHHPSIKTAITATKMRSLDDLIRQLCRDLEALKSYGMSGGEEGDVAAGLHRMLGKDIYGENGDVNCMWDLEWGRMRAVFGEVEDVVKDVERLMVNGLIDEIAQDFLVVV